MARDRPDDVAQKVLHGLRPHRAASVGAAYFRRRRCVVGAELCVGLVGVFLLQELAVLFLLVLGYVLRYQEQLVPDVDGLVDTE